MKMVRDLMTRDVKCCSPDDNLACAAAMMWDNDCGVVPVVDTNDRVIGVVTDRDICMAVATQNRLAADITIKEVMTGRAATCLPEDDISAVLKTMRDNRVRRVPIVNHDGRLQGIVSLNDIILLADENKKGAQDIPYPEILRTLKAVCEHRVAAVVATA